MGGGGYYNITEPWEGYYNITEPWGGYYNITEPWGEGGKEDQANFI